MSDRIPWEEIIKSGNLKPPKKSLLRYVLEEANYLKVVKSALKVLRSKDKKANIEQAASLVDKMKTFAQKTLKP